MTVARTLRWGFLGAARITRAIVPAIRAAQHHELVAVASRSLDKAREHAAQWSIPRALGSYEELLASPDIDIIYIPLPNSLHAEWTIRAAEAGKHVLCEKPLALSVDEVDRIAAAASRAGVTVAEAFMYRHHPQTLKIKQLIDHGAIGELHLIRGAFTFYLDRPGDVRRDLALGGGSIWDVGCYPISLARYIAGGEPTAVFGHAINGPTDIDEGFAGQLMFGDTVHAQFDSGFRAPFRTHAEIVGTTGAIQITRPFKPTRDETLLINRGDRVEQIHVTSHEELYLPQIEDLGKTILEGTPPRVSLADSRGNVATIRALLESARTGQPVSLASATKTVSASA
jgi:D-xylose 1-dehydrogenase (NADP+, D-xylono-1,5-lactone-forming)